MTYPTPSLSDTTLADVLELEELEPTVFRSVAVYDDPYPLYGGQIAAQALLAAGRTVPAERVPHSLHSYYLRGGTAAKPVRLHVEEDRDGRSYSARRVRGVQDGATIFTLSASFVTPGAGPEYEFIPIPDLAAPKTLPRREGGRMVSMEVRVTPQRTDSIPLPTAFWARSEIALPRSPLVHACVLTYISDASSGLFDAPEGAHRAGSSLDHAVWFHRPALLDDWIFVDLVPALVAGGRGFYTGTVRRTDGALLATLAQESLFR
ncbi:acyl-CoA thioesterase II [Nocardia nova]|uniref:Acyl-CoA thioesterase II n=1 Tax=Nocardia nova TaxID=37330 RepID=A0A2S6AVG1_9NOCA|nr:acyl-CoA thioesterase domain-containing protein [Nocardia nova]PPJ33476.1 acyl-CoA thioesterase II [Nocardia nova]PPJ39267.1 acyl-CoA thioesterase II [Nocardia nova]